MGYAALLKFFDGDAASFRALSSVWREATPNSYGALVRFEDDAIGHLAQRAERSINRLIELRMARATHK